MLPQNEGVGAGDDGDAPHLWGGGEGWVKTIVKYRKYYNFFQVGGVAEEVEGLEDSGVRKTFPDI